MLAGVLVIVVVGYLYVVEPLVDTHAATRELVVGRRSLLVRQQRLVARSEAYERELGGLRAEIGLRRARLLAGDKAPVAASEIQKLVKSTAQEAGIEIRSERMLAPVDRGGYAEVPVEVTLSGPVRGLTRFLHRLEEAPLLLAVTDLKVRVPAIGATRELSATLALSGFIPGPAAVSAPTTSVAPLRPSIATPPARPGT
jgi:hypothetical protein